MAAYLQMGHDMENLVGNAGLEMFEGIVLSPINRAPDDLARYIGDFHGKGDFDIVLDPQLYCPRNQRGQLPSHSYFPTDFDTADMSSAASWQKLAKNVATYGLELGVDGVCSPVVVPNRWSNDYFSCCVESFIALSEQLEGTSTRPLLSLCVRLKELSDPNDAFRIASLVTASRPAWCYLIVEAELEPRRELREADNLAALMVLVAAMERAGCKVLVSNCSSEMVLLKAASASHCATGKFFNLRRFTRGRFDEQEEGGRLIPYWFEHGLMAFLREADIARLRRDVNPDFLAVADSGNVFGQQILSQFANEPGKPWVALSWRQYLAWFGSVENRLSDSGAVTTVNQWLRDAEQRWLEIEDKGALFEEIRNDGTWIRRWRQALGDYLKCRALRRGLASHGKALFSLFVKT